MMPVTGSAAAAAVANMKIRSICLSRYYPNHPPTSLQLTQSVHLVLSNAAVIYNGVDQSLAGQHNIVALRTNRLHLTSMLNVVNNVKNKSIVDSIFRPRCHILINSTKHCSWLKSNWYVTWRISTKHNVELDFGHWSHGMKIYRHPQNRKYITHRNAVTVHRKKMHKKWWCSALWFSNYESRQTSRQYILIRILHTSPENELKYPAFIFYRVQLQRKHSWMQQSCNNYWCLTRMRNVWIISYFQVTAFISDFKRTPKHDRVHAKAL